ncbi:oligosaccharide flippase family protein [uncultured Desulfobacter sp.]|uniref:lipopolysaccharide biosynthesis protein n=1 Tax=uncultured Desulfobacter sp. TaxID=240139 RepID=UPI002AA90E21|nr:oligosaccharide flippase family protein [uncultured Desulfobacter sp.]
MQINNKRIARNTLMLYFRQILILLISLYTVRLVLDVLGVEDYGIYNVVGGVVSLFSFLGGTMASATQRFFSFALGQEDTKRLNKTFTVNLTIYGTIAVLALVLLESIGLWFVSDQLKLPPARFDAALLVYHYAVLASISTIFTSPFMAIIIAHEDMQIYAYVSIVEAILKLAIVFVLTWLPWDKLELYGMLFFVASMVNAVLYICICVRKYSECQFRKFYWDKNLVCEIMGFTGWTFFGQISTVARRQGVTILLNQAFSPVVVAARAIATNIAGRVNMFSAQFNVGLYPPIIKSYAANDKKEMFSLIFNGSKITFFLMWVFALPLFVEMQTVLSVWLKNPPPETVLFTRLALVESLIFSLSLPITTAARAPGQMKIYELTLGTIQIAIFVGAWIVLKMGGAAYTVYIIAIVGTLIMFVLRLVIVRSLVGLSLGPFFLNVVFPVTGVILFSAVPSFVVHSVIPERMFFVFFSILLSFLFSSISMYFFGIDKKWRRKIRSVALNRVGRFLSF